MIFEELTDRQHSAVDFLLMLAAVCLTLATWLFLSNDASVPLWKPYVSVLVTVLFTLAALTRQPRGATTIRLLAGLWIIGAPFLLKFAESGSALWAYLAIGILVTAMALPDIRTLRPHAGMIA